MPNDLQSMMSEHILITGVTGYIGFKTLTIALERGYRVRAVVRSERNVEDLKNKSTVIAQSIRRQKLEFVVIPDFLQKDAIYNALDGIDVIVHLASPLAIETDDYHAGIIQPAISMITSVLEAATRQPSVRRVVLTSSCVTLIPIEWNMDPDTERLYTVEDINTNVAGPFTSPMEAYWASKALARVATKEFFQLNHPKFDYVNLLPSVVIGPDDRLDADPTASVDNVLQGTRAAVLAAALTSSLNSTFPYVGTPVHVSDVARAHIDAIQSELVPGNSEHILSSNTPDGVVWDRDVQKVCREFFQEDVEKGILPLEGSLTSIKWRLDAQSTEKTFGWRFISFEETMKQLITQYLQIHAKSKV